MIDNLLKVGAYILAAYGLYVVFVLVRYKYDDYVAARHGCAVPFYSDREMPIGIKGSYMTMKSLWNSTILDFFQERISEARTVRTVVSGQRWFITIEPDNARTVLATSFKDYSLGFRYESFFPLLGNGIFTLSGEGWKHSRSMLRPQFSREQVSHLRSIGEHLDILMRRFTNGSKDGGTVDAQALYHQLTLDTATEFLFGSSSNTLDEKTTTIKAPRGEVSNAQFAESFTSCLLTLATRVVLGSLYWVYSPPGFKKNVEVCHNFVDYYVQKALEKPMGPDDTADRYVFINELTKETQDPIVIRDQAFNILLAGRDTTAALLSYCTFYLGRNKDVYKRLRESILADFGEGHENITFESLKRSKFLQNIINETLRLHPIVPLNFRTAIRDTKLPVGGGPNQDQPLFVPKGTNIFYLPYVMQRHPRYWGEDANEFKPDRWDDPETQRHTWDYIPFNGGPRICLGQQFALTEASYALVRVAQTFKDINIVHPAPNEPLRQIMRLTSSVLGGVEANFVPA
ncbi:hypothetical protein B9G98_04189 [Wickerhamiella sorbophila]|uniref:Cytochrome P450 52A13 n=1 Tax=Wickerhamiella sorbophila TaxID=45607 RepID=A0A2T0FNM8_9ASCO|nr:hypothetical protein B9G98_04189 [Wickerhamiella sorbophila]PRT56569.1 hypothetical protein B9G98_04189 [Wickerhamiella sorbophila]